MKTKVVFILMLVAFACYSLCPISVFAQTYTLSNMENPDPDHNSIGGLSGINNTVFAVGNHGTFLKYDGAVWTKINNPSNETLNQSWTISANDVWAVGFNGSVAHYNGSTISIINIGTTEILFDIIGFSANDIYVCGYNKTLFHYDGTIWSQIGNYSSTIDFKGMFGSSNDLYLTGGDNYSPYTQRLYHYDGVNLTEVISGNYGYGWRKLWSPDDNLFYIDGRELYQFNKSSGVVSQVLNGTTPATNTIVCGLDANNIIVWRADDFLDSLIIFNGSEWKGYALNVIINSIYSPNNNPNNVFLVGNNGTILHLDLTTGIFQPNVSSQLNIYPNPSNGGEINIDLGSNSKATVVVLNSVGQQVQTISSDGSSGKESLKINGDLPAGVYFIKVKTDAGDYNQKIVVTKN